MLTGFRARVFRIVKVANTSSSYRLKLRHYTVLKQVRIEVGRVNDVVVFWPRVASTVLPTLRMFVGLNNASPSSLPNSPLITEATVCIVPVRSLMASWVGQSIFCLQANAKIMASWICHLHRKVLSCNLFDSVIIE